MDVRQANKLFEQMERLSAEVSEVRDALHVEFLSSQLAEVVDTDYDLGEVVRVEQIFGGFENLSFAVITRDGDGERRNFVRKYKYGTVEREIRYEHALVRHIRDKGFELPARVFETSAGDTLVKREELLGGERVERFFAVYEMLTGEDKYTWTDNRCTDAEYEDGARILARFHQAAADFEPGDLNREQPPIMDYLATMPATFNGYAAAAKGTKYDHYLLSQLPGILAAIDRGLALAPELEKLPRCPTFCDYHPGNLKWRDGHGVGLFDFDWTKLDYRLFDIAIGIVYFCCVLGGPGRRRTPARQGGDLPEGLPGRGVPRRGPRPRHRRRARGAAAHVGDRRAVRGQLGHRRVLHRSRPERGRVPLLPRAQCGVRRLHRGSPR